MAFQPHRRQDYLRSMPSAYWLLAASLLIFVAIMTIFEFVGVPEVVITFLFIFVPLAGYILIGIASRTLQIVEFFVAGRRIPAVFNGMAAAANWVGATIILGLCGSLAFMGHDGLALLIGWSGGFVLAAVLFAPYLRKYGAFTIPDFFAARFGSTSLRLCSIIVLLASSAALMTAEFHAGGLIFSNLLGLEFETGVMLTLGVVLFCVVWGGIRGATWTQAAQFVVMGSAIFLSVTWISLKMTGNPFAPSALGELLEQIGSHEARHGVGTSEITTRAGELKSFSSPQTAVSHSFSALEFAAISLCLMLGAASMPHALMRFFTATDVRDARRSAGWALFFIALVFSFLPVAVLMAKIEIFNSVIGQPLSSLPSWVNKWAGDGLVLARDLNGNGRLGVGEFFIHPDALLLALPEISGLPFVLTALMAAGLLAAAISTASGLVLATSNGFAHDLYYRIVQKSASTTKRLVIARIVLILVASGSAWAAANRPMEILPLVTWSLSLAAGGNFVVLVFAIWWKRCTKWGALAAMSSGFGATLLYLVGLRFLGWDPIFGLGDNTAGLLGVAVSFVVAIVVSLATPAPSPKDIAFIDDIRTPRGQSFMERERAAERIREAGSIR